AQSNAAEINTTYVAYNGFRFDNFVALALSAGREMPVPCISCGAMTQ
ncbi:unnamed protein product, partial [marine sediment metagenome]